MKNRITCNINSSLERHDLCDRYSDTLVFPFNVLGTRKCIIGIYKKKAFPRVVSLRPKNRPELLRNEKWLRNEIIFRIR